jgi:membrane protease YdiL (CAAX protease family)
MRYLMDPALVQPGLVSWLYLALLLIVLPAAVLSQQRRLAGLEARHGGLARRDIYASAVITHGVLVLAAWMVMRDLGLTLFPPYTPHASHFLVAAAALGVGLLPLSERFAPGTPELRRRTALIAPRSGAERVAFAGVSLSAGVAEELAYRGALFALLASLLDGWWYAALVAAAAFGIVHLFQGWRGAGLAAALGLVAQLVVGFTGTLLLAMAVHVAHDVIAGLVIARRAERDSMGGAGVAVS